MKRPRNPRAGVDIYQLEMMAIVRDTREWREVKAVSTSDGLITMR